MFINSFSISQYIFYVMVKLIEIEIGFGFNAI